MWNVLLHLISNIHIGGSSNIMIKVKQSCLKPKFAQVGEKSITHFATKFQVLIGSNFRLQFLMVNLLKESFKRMSQREERMA